MQVQAPLTLRQALKNVGRILGRDAREDYLAEKARFAARVMACAENGKVSLISSGRDCDGSAWTDKVEAREIAAIPVLVNKEIEEIYNWADGPINVAVVKPSSLVDLNPTSRDYGMEAHENGHSHVLYV